MATKLSLEETLRPITIRIRRVVRSEAVVEIPGIDFNDAVRRLEAIREKFADEGKDDPLSFVQLPETGERILPADHSDRYSQEFASLHANAEREREMSED